MNTHILYSVIKGKNKYFSGICTGKIDEEGFAIIDFKWSKRIKDATEMSSPDAWDLLAMCRYVWPHLTLEVKRIKTIEEIQSYSSRPLLDIRQQTTK